MKRVCFFFILATLLGGSSLRAEFCCHRLQLAGWWGNVDYLLLWRTKRFLPPLVTTGALDAPGTVILFGDENVRRSPQSGVYADAGVWLTPCLGGGGSVFVVGKEKIGFDANNTMFPVLDRPFFDVVTALQSFEIVANPILAPIGSVSIRSTNSLCGGDLYVRYRYIGCEGYKFDVIGGFMYSNLADSLDISTQSQSATLVLTNRTDSFHAKNDYYAGVVGFITEFRTACWAVQCIGKVGLGNMIEHVDIHGSSAVAGVASIGGLLALPTNIGNHSRKQFEAIPQINVNAQLQVWPHMWLNVGYMYMFWPKVVLAGDQVDLDVNPTQQSGGVLVGTPAPLFEFKNKSFTLQGLTAGISFRF